MDSYEFESSKGAKAEFWFERRGRVSICFETYYGYSTVEVRLDPYEGVDLFDLLEDPCETLLDMSVKEVLELNEAIEAVRPDREGRAA